MSDQSNEQGTRLRTFRIDPSVSLSDILVAISMLAAGFAAYSNLDKRVAVNEASAALIAQQAAAQQAEQKTAINDLRSDMKDVQRSINDFIRAAGTKGVGKP